MFYNGTESTPDHEVLKLSDAFDGKAQDISLELVADVYNINSGRNSAIQDACVTLKSYSEFVRRIRENQKTMPLAQAVNKAVAIRKMGASLPRLTQVNRGKLVSIRVSGCGL